MEWNNIYITDKKGGKYFNTTASTMSTLSEIRNLKQHLKQAKEQPQWYKFLDVDSAVIMLNDSVYEPKLTLSDEDEKLLSDLLS